MDEYKDFIKNCTLLAAKIEGCAEQIISVLKQYESVVTAEDEIERSVRTLHGAKTEFADVNIKLKDITIATFFPLNLPLYSLVLFAIMPSAFARKVYLRAPILMQDIVDELFRLLDLDALFPEINTKSVSRGVFLEVYAKTADVILFTGKYANVRIIQQECTEALVIFNGSGVNPAIVFDNADVRQAAQKIFKMRTFNSGQDCAGTDAIFVHESIIGNFVEQLQKYCDEVIIGDLSDNMTCIGPTIKKDYIDELYPFLAKERPHTLRSGRIDRDRSIVHPTIIVKDIIKHDGQYHEFFAPIFYILKFRDTEELNRKINEPAIREYAMYISYFGDNPIINNFKTSSLLHNTVINDIERGNAPYGGYGPKANYVAFGDNSQSRPILISKEINSFYAKDGVV